MGGKKSVERKGETNVALQAFVYPLNFHIQLAVKCPCSKAPCEVVGNLVVFCHRSKVYTCSKKGNAFLLPKAVATLLLQQVASLQASIANGLGMGKNLVRKTNVGTIITSVANGTSGIHAVAGYVPAAVHIHHYSLCLCAGAE